MVVIAGCSGQQAASAAKPVNVASLGGKAPVTSNAAADSEAQFPAKGSAIQRNFAEQPPLIPHNANYPITLKHNSCLGCHSWDRAAKMKATPVAKSHVLDAKGTLKGENYFCTQCHVPQADNKQPLVGNSFSQQ
ncbi:nitrate reductase cytochrome c-type subunit [Shewanella dokdonensis]|uniref:Periplasmic nitrate reductase, electron transfer subunit n=1 Tax=Shewanella dokdonensis TaxID=712036 RepID=A0ABX8DDA6_9GAMM|nr:nitrate reductase cytochrome c-type subunit [Shewanella dokdonensis]QVK22400.1 nitrate reductase cytochrome c-type subunit [Shewanella dokdonensis]